MPSKRDQQPLLVSTMLIREKFTIKLDIRKTLSKITKEETISSNSKTILTLLISLKHSWVPTTVGTTITTDEQLDEEMLILSNKETCRIEDGWPFCLWSFSFFSAQWVRCPLWEAQVILLTHFKKMGHITFRCRQVIINHFTTLILTPWNWWEIPITRR